MGVFQYTFGKEEPSSQIDVMSRSAHGDSNVPLCPHTIDSIIQPDLQGFLDGEKILLGVENGTIKPIDRYRHNAPFGVRI
jgi:hypothetical protein